eukprot:TRINITY_DN42526_c0_g1_i1.p1 TRINITY_DN42526_c0_g1~~TRINITY_DN42526_c0_g1_i1.p1  ORF type:complete len:134 (+),score=13.56 TRINITY_DN42526_c0_g1_i1:52-453(+)
MHSPRRARLEALLREIDHDEVALISRYVDTLYGELRRAKEDMQYVEWERDEARWHVQLVSEENQSFRKRIKSLERTVYEQGKDLEAVGAQLKDVEARERASRSSSGSSYPRRDHSVYSEPLSSIPHSRQPLSS